MTNRLNMRLVQKSIYDDAPVLQMKYDFESWEDTHWFFRTSTEKKHGWIYVPEFNLWRSNISI